MSTAPPAVGAPESLVTADRYCIQCAYLLRGLPTSGKCPECGTEVAMSLREPMLGSASLDYVRKVNSGLNFVLYGILFLVLMMILSIGAVFVMGAANAQLAMHAAGLIGSIMIYMGYWYYTQPDPGQVAEEKQRAARKVIRIVVAIQAVVALAHLVLGLIFGYNAPPGVRGAAPGAAPPDAIALVIGALGIASAVAWIIQYFAVMRYTRWLASRVPDRWIVKRTKVYMWLLPVLSTVGTLVIVGPLIALILYWNLLDRLRKHTRAVLAGKPRVLLRGVDG